MTPEQNEQWQKAINPLDYLDFHALSEEGLEESRNRFTQLGVPAWASLVRHRCIGDGSEEEVEAWVPSFALRSEVALIGLQILHPTTEARGTVYRRLLFRFFHEALKPFAEWVAERNDKRGRGYTHLIDAYHFCGSADLASPILLRKWKAARRRVLNAGQDLRLGEIHCSINVSAAVLSWEVPLFHTTRDEDWWTEQYDASMNYLLAHLNRQHQWRVEGKGSPDNTFFSSRYLYVEPTAMAFLTTLETECPPPDWLDGALRP